MLLSADDRNGVWYRNLVYVLYGNSKIKIINENEKTCKKQNKIEPLLCYKVIHSLFSCVAPELAMCRHIAWIFVMS